VKSKARDMIYIISALFIALLPLIPVIPLWISIWCFMLWGYLVLSQYFSFPLPGRGLRVLLTLISVLGVAITSSSFKGGGGYIGLLAIMAALKPYEIKNHRDKMITLFAGYFIVITSLFRVESLVMTIYMFPAVFFITAIIIHINHPIEKLSQGFRLSFRIMLQAFPLVTVLFFFFPRLPGSIWGIFEYQGGSTGFSETLSPGDITTIVKNDEIAFRAEFESDIPDHSLLYWRGVTFDYFDGRTWGKSMPSARLSRPIVIKQRQVSYNIILEPHAGRYLFALDMPVSTVTGAEILSDYTFRSYNLIRRRFHYSLTSSLDYHDRVKDRTMDRYLQLPKSGNEKTRALAEKYRLTGDEPNRIIDKALSFFVENNFQYTLRPPALGKDSVDDFLFKTKKGYCEHYASAFAFLLRAANVPCRIVGGYQGGEVSPYGKYILVRQSDAHAWTEVWLEKKGWVRVDPTFAVSPQRVTLGVKEALTSEDFLSFFKEKNKGILGQLTRNLVMRWDIINSWWEFRFSAYDFFEQRFLLQALRIGNGKGPGFWTFFLVFILSFFIFVSLFFIHKKSYHPCKGDKTQEIYLRFCRKLKKIGLVRRLSQGPDDFRREIISARDDLAIQLDDIFNLYIELRYGRGENKENLKRFYKLVKQFNPE